MRSGLCWVEGCALKTGHVVPDCPWGLEVQPRLSPSKQEAFPSGASTQQEVEQHHDTRCDRA